MMARYRYPITLGFLVLTIAATNSCDRRIVQSIATRRTPLITESFTVGAREYRFWEFDASEGTRVVGRFEAEGGGGNDIECLLLDRDAFSNWRNGHSTTTYYNSGRVTVGTINARLRAGHYVLVFNNNFSILTSKAVNATIERE